MSFKKQNKLKESINGRCLKIRGHNREGLLGFRVPSNSAQVLCMADSIEPTASRLAQYSLRLKTISLIDAIFFLIYIYLYIYIYISLVILHLNTIFQYFLLLES